MCGPRRHGEKRICSEHERLGTIARSVEQFDRHSPTRYGSTNSDRARRTSGVGLAYLEPTRFQNSLQRSHAARPSARQCHWGNLRLGNRPCAGSSCQHLVKPLRSDVLSIPLHLNDEFDHVPCTLVHCLSTVLVVIYVAGIYVY